MSNRPHRWGASAAAFGALGFAWGCNAILGNADGVYVDAGGDADTQGDSSLGDAARDGSASDGPLSDGPLTDASPDACAADLTSDPRNCGKCGHDCLQGTCSGSACQPFALVGDAAAPERIFLKGTSLYWSSGASTTINRVGVDGSGKEEILAPSAAPPSGDLGIDGTGIYYAASPIDGGPQELRKCPLSGACAPEVITNFPGTAINVDADGVNVYVTAPPTRIFAVRESDHVNTPLVSSITSVSQIIAAPPFVYWGDYGNRVARVRNDGTDGGFFANTVGSAAYIGLFGNRMAWAGSTVGTSTYGTCDVTNCAGTKLNLTRAEDATGIDVDATSLYWVVRGSSANNGSVHSCSFADACATVKTAALSQAQPQGMAVTPQAIYWLNNNGGGNGAVMGVAK